MVFLMIPVRAVTTTSRAAAAPKHLRTKAVPSPLLRHPELDPNVMPGLTRHLTKPGIAGQARNDGEGPQ